MTQKYRAGMSLVVQWLRLCASRVGALGLIRGQETRSLMLKLTPSTVRGKKKVEDSPCGFEQDSLREKVEKAGVVYEIAA